MVVGRFSVACPKHVSSKREGALIAAGAECPGEQVSNATTSGFPLKAGYPLSQVKKLRAHQQLLNCLMVAIGRPVCKLVAPHGQS